VATETLAPNGDAACAGTWRDTDGNNCPGDIYSDIDEGLDAIDNSDYAYVIQAPAAVFAIKFDLENPTFSGVCTSIRVGLRNKTSFGTPDLTVRIYDGAQIGGDKTISQTTTEKTDWTSSWTGLSKSAADLADLQVELESTLGSVSQYVYTLDVEITYVQIDQVNDVDQASISEINDTAFGSVGSINDFP